MAYTRKPRIAMVSYIPDDIAGSASETYRGFEAEILSINTNVAEFDGGGYKAGRNDLIAPDFVSEHTAISFRRRILTHSTVDEVPSFGPLLRAAGWQETYGSNYAIYTLGDLHLNTDSTAGAVDPLDVWLYVDRHATLAKGTVGNVSLRFIPGFVPTIQYDGIGRINQSGASITNATESAMPSLYSYDDDPVQFGHVNAAMTFTYLGSSEHNVTSGLAEFTLETGNQIVLPRDASRVKGIAQPELVARTATCTFLVRENDFATWVESWDVNMRTNTKPAVSLTFKHGVIGTAGKQLTIAINSWRLVDWPMLVERDGIAYRQFTCVQNGISTSTAVITILNA